MFVRTMGMCERTRAPPLSRPGSTAACKRPGRLGLDARMLPRAAPRVVRAPGGRDLMAVLTGPGHQGEDRAQQALAERRQLVVHARRNDGMDGAQDEPVPPQGPQRKGQHPLADLLDLAVKLAEAQGALAERLDDQQ